jgi:prepilin-type N-terminal cleavage/methylation domain-containing protein
MRRGFTLLELIIVIIILAILASLAVPRFLVQTERARAAEALQHLSVIRGALDRYWVSNNRTYVGAVLTNADGCGAGYNLDIDCPNDNAVYPRRQFQYAVGGLAAGTYTITAVRLSTRGDGTTMVAADNITADQGGTITGAGVYTGVNQ